VKYLYNKKGFRRTDRERQQFAFFVIGALVVMAVVFVIGLQVGRMVERKAFVVQARESRVATDNAARSPAPDIGKELGSYAAEAESVPGTRPRNALEELAETEKSLTFRKTLAEKEPVPLPLVPHAPPAARAEAAAPPAAKPKPAESPGGAAGKYTVQAGAFEKKDAAESLRNRLAKAGIRSRVSAASGKDGRRWYRVTAGPYPDRDEARKTAKAIKGKLKVKAIVVAG
jgi:DedD protein